jgi:hypothetical protein
MKESLRTERFVGKELGNTLMEQYTKESSIKEKNMDMEK